MLGTQSLRSYQQVRRMLVWAAIGASVRASRLTQAAKAARLPRAKVFCGAVDPRSRASATIEISLRTTVWPGGSSRRWRRVGEKSEWAQKRRFVCVCRRREVLIGLDFFWWSLIGGEEVIVWGVFCFFFILWLGDNSLEVALEDFPMSASERWIGFLVWWRCFLSSTKLIFSFRSGGMRPSAICRSTMSSGTGKSQPHLYICNNMLVAKAEQDGQYVIYRGIRGDWTPPIDPWPKILRGSSIFSNG